MANSRTDAMSLAAARRRFLIKTLGLGAAGLAAGGAAAWTKGQLDDAATASASLGDIRLQLDQVAQAKLALEASYGVLQGQAADLQVRLDAANGQNTQLAGALNVAQQEKTDLATRLASAQADLDAARDRLAKLADLVSLYDQLDATGLDGLVAGGLATMSGALDALLGPLDLLRTGVQAARDRLSSFEAVLPDFNTSMTWLGDQVVRLKVGLWSVETTAKEVADSAAAGFAAVFGGFVGFVIDHLPFDIGKKVRATLSATQGVLAGVKDMSDQAADQVLLHISKYVDDGPQSWQHTLAAPLRDEALAPADNVMTGVAQTGATYKTALKDPADSVLEQRRGLREQIANYRKLHGL
jgi:hypothetical protein